MTIAIHTADVRQAADDIEAAIASARQNVQSSLDPSTAASAATTNWRHPPPWSNAVKPGSITSSTWSPEPAMRWTNSGPRPRTTKKSSDALRNR